MVSTEPTDGGIYRGQSGLGDVKFPGGLCHIACLCQGKNIFQIALIHKIGSFHREILVIIGNAYKNDRKGSLEKMHKIKYNKDTKTAILYSF